MSQPVRPFLEAAAAAVMGMLAVIAPVIIQPPPRWYDAPLFPMLRTAVERVSLTTLVGLAIVGLAGGLIARLPFYLVGLSTIALLPAAAIAEMTVDPTSHNLFPLEFIMYGLMSVPAILAAGAGRWLHRMVAGSRIHPTHEA